MKTVWGGIERFSIRCAWIAVMGALASANSSLAQFTTIINSPPDVVGHGEGIFSGIQVNVYEGGSIGSLVASGSLSKDVQVNVLGGKVGALFHANWGSVVNIVRGEVGPSFQANDGSQVAVYGGTVGDNFDADHGSNVAILGGSMGNYFNANPYSTVAISGGAVGSYFRAHAGSNITISGGRIGHDFLALPGSRVTVSGGLTGWAFGAERGSEVTLRGGDFRINGDPIDELQHAGQAVQLDLPQGALLSGILADGTPIAVSTRLGDYLGTGTTTLICTDLRPIGPAQIVTSADGFPLGIREGQTLVVDSVAANTPSVGLGRGSRMIVKEGGEVGWGVEAVAADVEIMGGSVGAKFDAVLGSNVKVSGGSVGDRFRVLDSNLRVTGGAIGDNAFVGQGSRVTILGGSVGRSLTVNDSELTMGGGTVGSGRFHPGSRVALREGSLGTGEVHVGAEMTIFGGSVAHQLRARSGSRVMISGGSIEDELLASDGSAVQIFGTRFMVDGVELDELSFGESVVISERNIELEALLVDGSPAKFDLRNTGGGRGGDRIDPGATLSITLVSQMPGDFDSSGIVDQGDLDLVLLHWREELLSPYTAGWINDLPIGVIGPEELSKVLLNWESDLDPVGLTRVPEPAAQFLMMLCSLFMLLVRNPG